MNVKADDLLARGIPTTVISFVGRQPAAIVVPVLTWARHVETPSQVALFASPQMRLPGERAHAFFREALPSTECTVEWLTGPPDTGNTALLTWLGTHARGHRVVVLVEPGLKVLTTALARQLRNAVALATDGTNLLVADPVRQERAMLPLENIGVSTLLGLHGLDTRVTVVGNPGSTRAGLKIRVTPSEQILLSEPREAAGFLYGLCRLPAGPVGRQKLRNLERLHANPQLLDGLVPRVTVVTDDDLIRRRAASGGMEVIGSAHVAGWQPKISNVGRAQGLLLAAPPQLAENNSPDLSGTLLTWLGPDATTTLLAIYSHKPSLAAIMIDCTTPRVVEVAHRLREEATRLPIGLMGFIESDLFGSLNPRDLTGARLRDVAFDFNCQAGTSMQSFAVAAATSAALWSIRLGSRGEVMPFDPASQPKALAAPPIDVLARVNGGSITSRLKRSSGWSKGDVETLVEVGKVLLQWMRANKSGALPALAEGSYEVDGRRVNVERVADRPTAISLSVDGSEGVRTAHDVSGEWFEDVVAACLVQSGADEVVRQIEWEMPIPRPDGVRGVRDELDVVARFGTRYFLFDCKAGQMRSLGGTATAGDRVHRALAEALASRLSRFAIPVATRPVTTPVELNPRGAAVVDLSVLTDTANLATVLEDLGRRRSSTET